MGKTFLAPALTLLLDVARASGVDPKPLLQRHAIDPRALRQPHARLRLDSVLRFFEDLERRLPDPSAGLSASRFWNPNAMGPLGYAWLTSRTLRAAFHRLARFNHIVTKGGTITVVERAPEGLVALRVDLVRPDIAPFLRMDASLALILAMTQALAGRDSRPLRWRSPIRRPRTRAPTRRCSAVPWHSMPRTASLRSPPRPPRRSAPPRPRNSSSSTTGR